MIFFRLLLMTIAVAVALYRLYELLGLIGLYRPAFAIMRRSIRRNGAGKVPNVNQAALNRDYQIRQGMLAIYTIVSSCSIVYLGHVLGMENDERWEKYVFLIGLIVGTIIFHRIQSKRELLCSAIVVGEYTAMKTIMDIKDDDVDSYECCAEITSGEGKPFQIELTRRQLEKMEMGHYYVVMSYPSSPHPYVVGRVDPK